MRTHYHSLLADGYLPAGVAFVFWALRGAPVYETGGPARPAQTCLHTRSRVLTDSLRTLLGTQPCVTLSAFKFFRKGTVEGRGARGKSWFLPSSLSENRSLSWASSMAPFSKCGVGIESISKCSSNTFAAPGPLGTVHMEVPVLLKESSH